MGGAAEAASQCHTNKVSYCDIGTDVLVAKFSAYWTIVFSLSIGWKHVINIGHMLHISAVVKHR
jgi:hypothetical protein